MSAETTKRFEKKRWFARITRGWGLVVLAIFLSVIAYWFVFKHWYLPNSPYFHYRPEVQSGRFPTHIVLHYIFEPANKVYLFEWRRSWRRSFEAFAGEYQIQNSDTILSVSLRSPPVLDLNFKGQKSGEEQGKLPKLIRMRFMELSAEVWFFDENDNGIQLDVLEADLHAEPVPYQTGSDFRSLAWLQGKDRMNPFSPSPLYDLKLTRR